MQSENFWKMLPLSFYVLTLCLLAWCYTALFPTLQILDARPVVRVGSVLIGSYAILKLLGLRFIFSFGTRATMTALAFTAAIIGTIIAGVLRVIFFWRSMPDLSTLMELLHAWMVAAIGSMYHLFFAAFTALAIVFVLEKDYS